MDKVRGHISKWRTASCIPKLLILMHYRASRVQQHPKEPLEFRNTMCKRPRMLLLCESHRRESYWSTVLSPSDQRQKFFKSSWKIKEMWKELLKLLEKVYNCESLKEVDFNSSETKPSKYWDHLISLKDSSRYA